MGILLATVIGIPFSYSIPILVGLLIFMLLVQFAIQKMPLLKGLFTASAFLFFIALGHILHSRILPKNQELHYTHISKQTDTNTLLEIKEILKPTSYQNKYIGKVYSVDSQNRTGDILININKDSLDKPEYLSLIHI